MRLLAGPLTLIIARARRRPGRWLLIGLGIGLTVAFAGAVAAQGTIAGDQAARSVLLGLAPLDRAVRVTWQGPVSGSTREQATALLRSLGLAQQTEVDLLNPVRLDGIIVRPAAIEPLARWTTPPAPGLAPCGQASCPVLAVDASVGRATLTAAGVRLTVAGLTHLRSAAPLGFTPAPAGGQPAAGSVGVGGASEGGDGIDNGDEQPPVLLTGDVAGLDALAGLSGVYRAHSWLALLPTATLHSWQLAAVERRLQLAQASLLASNGQFSLSAPFDALDAARAQADAAPRRLLLAGGGALAALVVFIVLAADSLRRDQRAEIERLQTAGARSGQCLAFAIGEASLLCLAAVVAGAVVAVGVCAVLAAAAGLPSGAVLAHSVLNPLGATALAVGWGCATALVAITVLSPSGRIADALALAAVAALAVALTSSHDRGAVPVLLAPLCCLAAGVIVFRLAGGMLRLAERVARRGPIVLRLALVSLARAPSSPALAIAFVAVSVGLGAFALAYRATLLRGTADQAAQQVPLDATVSPAADFTTPLQLASPGRWSAISGGTALPVRRTEATFTSGSGAVTVPAVGVPAATLTQIHGWRPSDGSAPPAALANRLAPPGPVRVPGPLLPSAARWLSLASDSAGIGLTVTADLRARDAAIHQVLLGTTGAGPLRARLPAGKWELEALELDEPTGLQITNGHQNGENTAATTQADVTVTLGPLVALGRSLEPVLTAPIGGWRGVGSATAIAAGAATAGAGAGRITIRFAESGFPGIVRPPQPSDYRPVPVLVDPQTAAAADRSRQIALTIDGQPVQARAVGVLTRFPTIDSDAAGFVVADEATLASALDAQLPGQGRPDELWIATSHPARLRAALSSAPLSQLGAAFRTDIEHRLKAAPIARGVLATLVAATALSGALAVLGLLVALLGDANDRVQDDLTAQGVGPRGLRAEVRLRLMIAALIGIVVGLGIGALLTRLAVATVRAAGTVAVPQPPLVTVAPWGQLALWGLAASVGLTLACLLATHSTGGGRRARDAVPARRRRLEPDVGQTRRGSGIA